MDDKKKYLLVAVTFVAMMGIGFIIGTKLNPKKNTEEMAYVEHNGVSSPQHEKMKSTESDDEKNNNQNPVENDKGTDDTRKKTKDWQNTEAGLQTDKPAKTPVEMPQGISREEFQSHLLNKGSRALDPGKGIVSKNLRVVAVGMRKGEQRPTDIESIRRKLAFGTWKSVSVVGLNYDKNGQVTQVSVSPIYPENTSDEDSEI